MGSEDGLPERLDPAHENEFPNLVSSGYVVTSRQSDLYNCIAYAVGDNRRLWDSYHYWPTDAPKNSTIEALVKAFESVDFQLCAGNDLEPEYEKVALYVDKYGRWTHASLQLEDGAWSSKLGRMEDIRHSTPYVLNSSLYGEVMYFMKRRRANQEESSG